MLPHGPRTATYEETDGLTLTGASAECKAGVGQTQPFRMKSELRLLLRRAGPRDGDVPEGIRINGNPKRQVKAGDVRPFENIPANGLDT